MVVQVLELVADFSRNVSQLIERVGVVQATPGAEFVVAWQPVVTASLNVQSAQRLSLVVLGHAIEQVVVHVIVDGRREVV